MKWQELWSSTFCHLNQPNPLGFVFNLWLRVRFFVHFNSKGSRSSCCCRCFCCCCCCCCWWWWWWWWRWCSFFFLCLLLLAFFFSNFHIYCCYYPEDFTEDSSGYTYPANFAVHLSRWFFQNVPFWSLPDPSSRFSNLMSIFSWCWPQQPIFGPFFQTGERMVHVHAFFPRRGEEAPPTLVPKAIFEVRKDLTSGKSLRIQLWEVKFVRNFVGKPYKGLTPLQIEAPGMGFCSE